jgi:hypothetical protein
VPVPAVLLLDRQMEVISLATLTEVSLPYLLDVRKEKDVDLCSGIRLGDL